MITFRDVLNLLSYTKSCIKHHKLKNDNAFEVDIYMKLYQRSHRVSIADATSPPRCLEYGVPQGSVLGPLLFTHYMAPLQDVI